GRTDRSRSRRLARDPAAIGIPSGISSLGKTPAARRSSGLMSLSRPTLIARTIRENDLLDQVAAGGRRFDRVLFTRNRRVMVSVSDRGRTLRLHEAFDDAPVGLLREIGAFCAGPGSERGRGARQT